MTEDLVYLDHLGDPFLFLEERRVDLGVNEQSHFRNQLPKVLFVLEGCLALSFDGGSPNLLKAGDVAIILDDIEQTYRPPLPDRPGSLCVLRLTFSPETVRAESGQVKERLVGLMPYVLPRLPPVAIVTPECSLGGWISEMRTNLHDPMPGARQRINAVARLALLDLIQGMAGGVRAGSEGKGSAERLVGKVISYLEAHSHEVLTLAMVARVVDRSEEHVARVFRKHTGRTVFNELQRIRIERGKYLLLCSELSVTQIAERCGFATLAHFSRIFRAQTQHSPRGYREKRLAISRPEA